MPPIIEARGLTKRFGEHPALCELDLMVEAGEAVAIFGPNGAGKTTLIRVLTQALRPSAGTLRLGGLDPHREPAATRGLYGVISHHTFLYHELTARENLRFFSRLYGVTGAEARIEARLREVGLHDRADDPAGSFSRGMQQRLSLARCLIHDPRLVFLDEPFTGLDPHASRTLRETLMRLREDGRTLLLVTHDLARGLELSQRWMLLHRGRIAAHGASAEQDPRGFEDEYRRWLDRSAGGVA